MEYRVLTQSEIQAVKNEGISNMEILVGQDHYWYLYSNVIDAYYDTGIRYKTLPKEEDVIKKISCENKYHSKDAVWIFGDDVDI